MFKASIEHKTGANGMMAQWVKAFVMKPEDQAQLRQVVH